MAGQLIGSVALITGLDSGIAAPFKQKAIDDPKYLEQQVQSIPLKRAGEPWEIGRLAVFLASKDADYVTGSTYVMDGGLMQNQGQGA